MDLRLDLTVAQGLISPSQIARRVTEDWATRSLFCVPTLAYVVLAFQPLRLFMLGRPLSPTKAD